MTAERVDALLVAAGVVLVVGTSVFAGRLAWRLADRVVDWIAARARARRAAARASTSTPATVPTIPAPAPAEHPSLDELVAAREEARRDALLGVRLAEQVQLGAALRGDRGLARQAHMALEYHRNTLCAIERAEGASR